MATIKEKAAHTVNSLFSLYYVYLLLPFFTFIFPQFWFQLFQLEFYKALSTLRISQRKFVCILYSGPYFYKAHSFCYEYYVLFSGMI